MWPHGMWQIQFSQFDWKSQLCKTVANYFNGEGRRVNRAQLSAILKVGCIHVYREHLKCHSQSFRESGAQSTDWLLAGARLWGLDTELLLWMLLPKLVPSCRRLMWRITAVALKACCEESVWKDKCNPKDPWRKTNHCTFFYFKMIECIVFFLKTVVLYVIWQTTSCMLTLHLLLAKFFRICRLTDSCMFLQRAVSPAILKIRVKSF